MKEITGKSKLNSNRFFKSIKVNGKAMKKNNHTAVKLNKYITTVGPNKASKIKSTFQTFEDFLFSVEENMEYRDLTFE